MDDIFKNDYKCYAFAFLPDVERSWMKQVVNMPELWDKVGQCIDRTQFTATIISECQELDLPYNTYNLDEAFNKAQNEWADELIIATATYILKWYVEVDEDLYLPDEVVELTNGHILVKDNLGHMIKDYLEQYPCHESEAYLLSLVDIFAKHNEDRLNQQMNALTL